MSLAPIDPCPCVNALHQRYANTPDTALDPSSRHLFHAAIHPEEPTAAAATRWLTRLNEVERFLSTNQRWPNWSHNNADLGTRGREGSLHGWVKRQRERSRAGQLCAYQEERLECLPGWDPNPRHTAWTAMYTAYREFVHRTGRAPRRGENVEETRLARWAAKQKVREADGNLTHAQVNLLKQL